MPNNDDLINNILNGLTPTNNSQSSSNDEDVEAILAGLGLGDVPGKNTNGEKTFQRHSTAVTQGATVPTRAVPTARVDNAPTKAVPAPKPITPAPQPIKEPMPTKATAPQPVQADTGNGEAVDYMQLMQSNRLQKDHTAKAVTHKEPITPKNNVFEQDPNVLNYFTVEHPENTDLDTSSAKNLPDNLYAENEDVTSENKKNVTAKNKDEKINAKSATAKAPKEKSEKKTYSPVFGGAKVETVTDETQDDEITTPEVEPFVFEDLSSSDLDKFHKQDAEYDEIYKNASAEKSVSSPKSATPSFSTPTAENGENIKAETAPKEVYRPSVGENTLNAILTDVLTPNSQNGGQEEAFSLPVELDTTVIADKKGNTLSNFNLNHGVEKEDFRKFFSTTVSLDEVAEKQHMKRPPLAFAKKIMEKAETQSEDEAIEFDEDENETTIDYENQEDAQDVLKDLKSKQLKLILRTAFTTILAILSIYIGLSQHVPFLSAGNLVTGPFIFVIANLVLLVAAIFISIQTVTNGILTFFSQPSTDLLPTSAAIAAIIQLVALLFNTESYSASPVIIFSTIAILGFLFNCIGKCLQMKNIIQNFDMSISRAEYSAAYILTDENVAKKVTENLAEESPRILVSRETALVKGFLKHSFSTTDSDLKAKKCVIVSFIAGAVFGLITYLFTKNLLLAFTAFTAAVCLGAPLSSTLVSAIPNFLMHNAASRVGAIIAGSSAVNTIAQTNVVMANARDIFPAGTVRLRGMKTFDKQRIDLAILYAASIFVQGCDTLRDIFLSIIEGNTDMLYNVENLTKEVGYGFVGWIENNRIIIGNREMMKRHDIEIPSLDYEERYTKNERQPIYLAVAGKLFGMFLVKYIQNNEVGGILDDLRQAGISLLVTSDDFCITNSLIENLYSLRPGTVSVMSQTDIEALTPSLAYLPKSEGVMSHLGTFSSCLGGLYAATSAKSAEKIAGILQTCGSIIGLVIIAVLTLTQGIGALSLTAVILFLMAWLLITVAIPLLKKY